MRNTFKLIISLIFISFCSSVASANEKFCLDKEGFIYPLFEEVKCNTDENEKEITKNEFLYLIDLEGKLRVSKLEELKKNPEILKKVEEENTVVKKIEQKKELSISEKRKLEIQQKKIARLAKELERKELLKAKKEKRLLEQSKRRAELKKKSEERKKEADQKRLKRIG